MEEILDGYGEEIPPPKVSTEGVSETPAETKSKRVLKHKVA